MSQIVSILDWFSKRQKSRVNAGKLNIPGDLWVKCKGCAEVLFAKDLEANMRVCSSCNYHFRVSPDERLRWIFDENSFVELSADLKPVDFLNFSDTQKYSSRLKTAQEKSKKMEAVVVGHATLQNAPVNVEIGRAHV